jgi:hypothetical protein
MDMELATIVNQYHDAFLINYADTALPGHLKALNAIGSCRTPYSGKVYVHCPDCNHWQWRPQNLGAQIAMTMVLHTHNRKLDFHPHLHEVVPGGGVDKHRRQWKKKKGKYLFNKKAMAKVFISRCNQ